MSPEGSAEQGFNLKREALHLTGWPLLALSFQTLGIIYSDIGTSPLYVLNGIWPSNGPMPSKEDIIGGISAIIWALTLLPMLKYVWISLHFGTTEGEGGSFALYQGLYPREGVDYDADRTLTGEYTGGKEQNRPHTFKEKVRWPLLLLSLFGTALTMADGVFTPAVSVTSAVGGIAVAKPSVSHDVVPISIAFLVVLFAAQQFGTARLSFLFSPLAFLWFLLLIGTGIYNITFFPGIFRAFDPSRAVLLFVRTRNYDLLAGVLLSITGCEAMFANLGQFNATAIRMSFCTFVYPGLVLAYLGQGARLIHDGEAILGNVFYNSIPGPKNGPLFWILFTFAILATLIASQALITGTFSLIQQIINTKAFPPILMKYTSETIQGQVYVPAFNWALMVATVVVVAAFGDLSNLTNAYGFAVATVMFSTSFLLAIQMRWVKHWPFIVGVVFFAVFGFFDALFWGASLKKVPHGAWVPLMIGSVLESIMVLWVWAKSLEDTFDRKNRMNLKHFIHQTPKIREDQPPDNDHDPNDDQTTDEHDELSYYFYEISSTRGSVKFADEKPGEKRELQRIPSAAVFHKITTGKGVPHTFVEFIRQWPALPRVVVFLSVCILPIARVPPQDRYVVSKVRTIDGIYGCTYYIGFRDKFDVRVDDMVDKICSLECHLNPAVSDAYIQEIRDVCRKATHVAPHYYVVSKKVDVGIMSPVVNYVRAILIESIYRRIATMFPDTANWLTSADEIIHVGINAII